MGYFRDFSLLHYSNFFSVCVCVCVCCLFKAVDFIFFSIILGKREKKFYFFTYDLT